MSFYNEKRINICEHAERWNHVAPSFSEFTYIYSLLIKKDICVHWNVSVKVLFVYVCLSSGDLLIFSVRVSSLFSYSCVIPTLVISHGNFHLIPVRMYLCFKIYILTVFSQFINLILLLQSWHQSQIVYFHNHYCLDDSHVIFTFSCCTMCAVSSLTN